MLGLGWSELLILSVIVLIVVGPKDLPMMLRNLGQMLGSVRRMSNEFRREIDKAIALDEVKEAQKAISDPLRQTSAEISKEFNKIRDGKVEPSGKIKPSEPGKESVADEIREKAGLPPAESAPEAPAQAKSPVVAGASGAATPAKTETIAPKPAARAGVKGKAPARAKSAEKPAGVQSTAKKAAAKKAPETAGKKTPAKPRAAKKTAAASAAKSKSKSKAKSETSEG